MRRAVPWTADGGSEKLAWRVREAIPKPQTPMRGFRFEVSEFEAVGVGCRSIVLSLLEVL